MWRTTVCDHTTPWVKETDIIVPLFPWNSARVFVDEVASIPPQSPAELPVRFASVSVRLFEADKTTQWQLHDHDGKLPLLVL